MNKTILLIVVSGATLAMLSAGCAQKRTRYSDKTMRVMIDPDSIDSANYVRLQQALIESGKWEVIDRYKGYKAMKKEQERQHRTEADRFEDKQKWAMWGKMYGVGGIVVPNAQCQTNFTWLRHRPYAYCLQTLSIVDANTGEVITMVSHKQEGEVDETYMATTWEDTVERFNKAFPSTFKPVAYTERLQNYMKEAEVEAQKQRESQRQPAAPDTPVYIEKTHPFVRPDGN